MIKNMVIAILAGSVIGTAVAQQAPQQCPDYSRQLAMGVQATYDRDSALQNMRMLDTQVTELKKQLSEVQEKLKTADATIVDLQKTSKTPK